MRYDRVENCPNGVDDRQGGVLHTWCDCHNGEIRTPVEHTEKWAVYNGKRLVKTGGSEDQAWAWAMYLEFGTDMEDDKAIEGSIRIAKEYGYTCEQIHVIRKEPNEE